MEYRYVNIEFGIDLGGKYSYHCFIKAVISKLSSFADYITPFSQTCCVSSFYWFWLNVVVSGKLTRDAENIKENGCDRWRKDKET